MKMEHKVIVDVNGELVVSDVNLEALMERIAALESENKRLHTKTFGLETQLKHLVPRVNEIEDKIDWRK